MSQGLVNASFDLYYQCSLYADSIHENSHRIFASAVNFNIFTIPFPVCV